MIHTKIEPTPIGALRLVSNGDAVVELSFSGAFTYRSPNGADPVLEEAAAQLRAYFSGQLRDFDLPLAPHGTPFQQRVWRALRQIPYGRTCSYSEIAALIDEPGKARAVGVANGRNPIAIIIPCHRVIGADGELVGYGGGLKTKRWLLELESGVATLPLFQSG